MDSVVFEINMIAFDRHVGAGVSRYKKYEEFQKSIFHKNMSFDQISITLVVVVCVLFWHRLSHFPFFTLCCSRFSFDKWFLRSYQGLLFRTVDVKC